MHAIILASYITAAAAFLAATGLLAVGWRGQRTGALLVVATAVSMAWGVLLAWAEWTHTLAIYWLLLAEVLRYGAWLAFLGALLGSFSMSGLLRGVRIGTQVLWIALALYCLWPATGLAPFAPLTFNVGLALVGVLLLALIGVVFLEQIFRNVDPEQRWAIKFLVIALGLMFVYDIFLYSYAVLYREFNVSAWAARGFVDALLAPLLVAAAARKLKTVDGLGMLLHQARPGFAAWFGVEPEVTPELREFVLADIPR